MAVLTGDPDPARAEQLAANLAALTDRIAAAARAAGRSPDELTLIAITKTFPADDVRRLAALGVTDFGENRDQEASRKAADTTDLDIRWHFVGRLQRNKAKSVAGYAHCVHSVDRPELAEALDRAATRPLDVLIQVNLEPDASHRGGAQPADVPGLADTVAACDNLRLAGVMAVAPLGADPEPAFAALADIAAGVRNAHTAARIVSAGMSADLEAAVKYGATHLRVGTALLGGRAPIVG